MLAPAVQQLTCVRDQSDSTIAFSKQSPTEPNEGSKPKSTARWVNTHDVNCVGGSLRAAVSPTVGPRLSIAIPKALAASDATDRESIDQPTTPRLEALPRHSVDETSIPKRHRYVTVLVHGDTGEVAAMVPHRNSETLSVILASRGHVCAER